MSAVDFTDRIAVEQERDGYASLDRDDTIRAIRAALKRRSGKSWSVTGGRGTAWGWITIDAPPRRRSGDHMPDGADEFGRITYRHVDTGEPRRFGIMTPADCAELAQLLGLERVHPQGVSIPAGTDYRIEYVARAEGRAPSAFGTPYWD